MVKLINKIRILLKYLFDKISNDKLKKNLLQAIPFWIASIITSFVAIFYAQVFTLTEKLSTKIFHYQAWLLFIITPICFILARWLVVKFAPYSKGSGIPQVMAAIELATPKHDHLIKKLLSFRIALVKILSSIIMVFGGGAIGKEGPVIHIAGSIFRKINNLLPAWWPTVSKKNMIMAGAAAGLAAAFNTPLGGIVFAVEELTKVHLSNFKAAILSAVIIAGLIVQSMLGSYLYIGFPTVTSLSNYIIFIVILVAIIAGIMGSGMAKIMWYIFIWKSKFNKEYQHTIYLLFCSLIIASLAYFVNENILGSGKSLITSTLFTDEKHLDWYVPLLRTIGPILSFTTGASGGVFAPGLSGGGTVGSVISGFLNLSASDTNLLILSGMVAFLTGITRTPFTSAILVLEMTERNNLILYLMLAGIVANFVSALIGKHSIYDYLKYQYMHEITHEEDIDSKEKTLTSNA